MEAVREISPLRFDSNKPYPFLTNLSAFYFRFRKILPPSLARAIHPTNNRRALNLNCSSHLLDKGYLWCFVPSVVKNFLKRHISVQDVVLGLEKV
jgi:hypothetical protein